MIINFLENIKYSNLQEILNLFLVSWTEKSNDRKADVSSQGHDIRKTFQFELQ